MNRTAERIWELYDAAPSSLRLGGQRILRFLKGLASPVPLTLLRGQARLSGQPGTVIAAGSEPWIDYLPERFFEGTPQRQSLGKVPLWALQRALQRLWASADLVIARVDKLSAGLLFGADYLSVPEWVDLWLSVPEDLDSLQRGRTKGDVRTDLRRVRQHGLTCEVSHAEADLHQFYNDFYVPFVRKRFGRYAFVRNLNLFRRRFREGALIWVLHDGQRIAGSLFYQRGGVLYASGLGTMHGEYDVAELGAIIATYWYKIQYAHALDCKEINFGGCRPVLTDGLLRYKRKWGMRLVEQAQSAYQFLVYWTCLNDVVAAFLAHTPLIFHDQGGLSAVTAMVCDGAVTEEDAQRAHRFLWTPGLHKLYLLSASGWEAGCKPPPQTCLVDLAGAEDDSPATLFTS